MNTLERAVVGANVLMAAVAAVANLSAARTSLDLDRAVRVAVGTLAGIYAVAYLWLFTHPDQIIAWSSVLRGVSILTWPIVWTAPALLHVALKRRTRRRIAAAAER